MAFIPIPNGIALTFYFTSASQNWQFSLTLRKSAGEVEITDLQQATADGSAWWTSFLKPQLATSTSLTSIVASDQSVEGGNQYQATVNEAATGSGSAVPLNACVVISGRTAKRGRSYRGRSYLSGLRDAILGVSMNAISSAFASTLAGGFASLASTLDGHGLDHVIASKQHNGAPVNPAETNEVTAYVVDTNIDSQRRRLTGRGT